MTFAGATAVETNDGITYHGAIHPGWDVVGNANGGYLLTIGARAMAASASKPHPVTLTAHFLSPGKAGPVTVEPQVIKQGRTFATGRAELRSEERSLASLLGTPPTSAVCPAPGGPVAGSPRSSSPVACSRRTAKSGTNRDNWLPRAANSP